MTSSAVSARPWRATRWERVPRHRPFRETRLDLCAFISGKRVTVQAGVRSSIVATSSARSQNAAQRVSARFRSINRPHRSRSVVQSRPTGCEWSRALLRCRFKRIVAFRERTCDLLMGRCRPVLRRRNGCCRRECADAGERGGKRTCRPLIVVATLCAGVLRCTLRQERVGARRPERD